MPPLLCRAHQWTATMMRLCNMHVDFVQRSIDQCCGLFTAGGGFSD